MPHCFLAFAVCALFPAASGVEDVEASYERVAPLIAPKPLIPLDQMVGPLPEDYVIARLDGKPIRLVELFDVAGYTAKLREIREKVPAEELRTLQEDLLKRDLRIFLCNRLCARAFQQQLSDDDRYRIGRGLHELWQNEVKKMQTRYDVNSTAALEDILQQQRAQSLSSLRGHFENRIMAAEYLMQQAGSINDRDERAKACEALQMKLLAEADLEAVVDLTE